MDWKLGVSQTRLPPGAPPAQAATLGTIPCNDSYIKLLDLRSRWYDPASGRFTTRDVWRDYNRPQSLNGWAYVEGNVINLTDPSGHCIFTGVDTVACLAALAIGVPVVAGVTSAAWNWAVAQGGGLGGANQNHQGCIDWQQVLYAGKNGSLGSVDTMVTIPLGPAYLVAAVFFNKSPIDVNESLLSHFGLGDQYRAALADPYFVAGRAGGSAAATYISLATFVKGLPQGIRLGNIRPDINGTGTLVLTVEGLSVVGGNGQLVFVGSAGAASSYLTMISGRGGRSPTQGHHPWPKYLGGPENQPLYRLPTNLHEEFHTGLDRIFSRYNGRVTWSQLTRTQQSDIIQSLLTWCQDFDADYGTHTLIKTLEVLDQQGISY